VAIACGACPSYGLLDPAAMAEAAIDEALRNAVAVGADPSRAAILDNFSWGNCERPEQLGALVLAARACHRAAVAYGAPFISGKDSLNNEFRAGARTLAIPPTLLISALVPVPDVSRAVTMDLKGVGNALYQVGLTRAELGGSVYLEHLGFHGQRAAGRVPRPDLERAPAILAALHAAIAAGLVQSAHDLSEGGLAVAAAEMAFAGELGLDLDLARVPCEPLPAGFDGAATRLYAESCTRFLVEVAPEHAAAFEARFAGLPSAAIGVVVQAPRLAVADGRRALFSSPLDELRAAHRGGFQG
jgi:phosphoribosylformylglycinamidine synthase